jgi:hypothetical protein
MQNRMLFRYETVISVQNPILAHAIFFPNIGENGKGPCVISNILDTNIVSSVKMLVA